MNKKNKTKILLLDIETAPNIAYIWAKYEQNALEFLKETYILCFSFKWLGAKTTHAVALPDFKRFKKDPTDDLEVVQYVWKLLDEADIVIAHNGDAFDIKKINARFLFHGMKPPSPYRTVDTKKAAKRVFAMNSNKLDDIGNYLKLGRKMSTGGWDLWSECLRGNMKSWKKMVAYNIQDVVLLEKVYLKLLPWILNHPNVNAIDNKPDSCPNCGSNKLHSRGTVTIVGGTVKTRYQCQTCGKWGHSKQEKSNVNIKG